MKLFNKMAVTRKLSELDQKDENEKRGWTPDSPAMPTKEFKDLFLWALTDACNENVLTYEDFRDMISICIKAAERKARA